MVMQIKLIVVVVVVVVVVATLAIRTVHRAVTATAAHSPKHSWQELTTSHLTK